MGMCFIMCEWEMLEYLGESVHDWTRIINLTHNLISINMWLYTHIRITRLFYQKPVKIPNTYLIRVFELCKGT